jgi:hypothetical protein
MKFQTIYKSFNLTYFAKFGLCKGLEAGSQLLMEVFYTDGSHLIVFDRNENRSWEEKIFRREDSFKGKEIWVWGM